MSKQVYRSSFYGATVNHQPDCKSRTDGACPVCKRDHDTDCRWFSDLKTVLCYTKGQGGTSSVPEPPDEVDTPIGTYKFIDITTDRRAGKYVQQEQRPQPRWEKPERPTGRTDYLYRDADGKPVVKVIRKDDGNGKKTFSQLYRFPNGDWEQYDKNEKGSFVSNMPAELKEQLKHQVPLYNLPAVLKAIDKGEPVFLAEGESCAKALADLGMTATTLIAGAGKLKAYNSDALNVLKGATVILCPDRDQKGVSHMEEVEAALHGVAAKTQWLYAEPDSSEWSHLQKDGGADVADWLSEGVTKAQILSAAGAKRKTAAVRSDMPKRKEKLAGNVIDHPTKQRLTLSKTELDSRITELAKQSQSLKVSEIELDLDDLAKESGRDALTVRKAYEARLEELEAEESADEKSVEIDSLLKLGNYEPTLTEFLHPELAKPLTKVADLLGTSHAAVLTSLLPIIGSLAKVGTSLELRSATGFLALPIVYTCLVCESGGMKSPTQKMVLQGLFNLQRRADEQYELANKRYQAEEKRYQAALKPQNKKCSEGGRKEFELLEPPEPPEPPKLREFFTMDATREAVARIQCNQPGEGFLGYFDELVALFKAMGQYSNGRGSDMEDLLSGRDGGPLKINRVGGGGSGVRYSAPQKAYSIVGGIQPGVLGRIMGDFSDENGCWARFLFCWMPGKMSRYSESGGSYDIDALTTELYSKIAEYESKKYLLSKDARELYIPWYNRLADLCEAEPKPALKSVLSKMQRDTGVLALLLHLVNAAAAGEQQPASEVSVETMQSAIRLAKYYVGQARLLHIDGGAANGDEEAIIVKLVQLSDKRPESSEGWIDAQLAKNYLNFFKRYQNGKPAKAADIQRWFQRAVELGYGELSPNGKKWRSKKWSDSLLKDDSNSSIEPEEVEMVQDFEKSPLEPAPTVIAEYKVNEEFEDLGGDVTVASPPGAIAVAKGSTVRYCGSNPSLAQVCGQKRLTVIDVSTGLGTKTVEVRAEGWSVTRKIPLSELRLTRGIKAVST